MKPKIDPFKKIIINASPYVSDHDYVKRSWKERLFTKPWMPLKRTKTIHSPRIFIWGNTIIVSCNTFQDMKRGYFPKRLKGFPYEQFVFSEVVV